MDPGTVNDSVLRDHGLPGRPDPRRWNLIMARSVQFIRADLAIDPVVTLRHQRRDAFDPADLGGVVGVGLPGSGYSSPARMVLGEWVVPEVLAVAPAGPGLTIGFWVGLDGYQGEGPQVLRAGVAATIEPGRVSSPVNRLNLLRVQGTSRGRRGEAGAWELLDEALDLAEGTGEPRQIVPVRAARAELRWLAGQPDLAVAEARSGYDCGLGRADAWLVGSVAIWLFRLGQPAGEVSGLPEPFALEMADDWLAAAAAWERLGRPTTPPWPGSVARTRPRSGRPWPGSTTWAPGPPPPWPGVG